MSKDRKTSSEELAKELSQLQEERKNLNGVITRTNAPEAKVRLEAVNEQISQLAEKQAAIDQQDSRIKEAQGRASDLETRNEDLVEQQRALKKRIEEAAEAFLPKNVSLRGDAAKDAKQLKEDNAVSIAHGRLTNMPFAATGWNTDENDRIAKQMRKAVKEHDEDKQMKKLLKEFQKMSSETKEHHEHEASREAKHEQHMERAADHMADSSNHSDKH